MPYDINQFSPTYGGVINSDGNVVNVGDTINANKQTNVSIGKGQTSALFVFQDNATALGNGNVADVSGYTTASIEFVETGSQIISVEGSLDQISWYALNGTNLVSSTTPSAVLNATGLFRFNLTGINFLRCRVSTFTSGSAYVSGYFTANNLFPFAPTTSTTLISADAIGGAQLAAASAAFNMISNGTSFDRQRSASADALAATGITAAGSMGYNGTTWDRIRTVNTGQLVTTIRNSTGSEISLPTTAIADGGSFSYTGIATMTNNFGYNGASYDRIRVGKTYKYIEFLNLANATATTVWTPSSGKKFRLMGVKVASSAAANVHLRDSGTKFDTYRFSGAGTITFDFGNGYISVVANNVLEIYNDTGSAVSLWVTAWGTEE